MDERVMDVRMAQWKKILEAQLASGLPKEKWCEENNIPRWQFYRWQKKIRNAELPPDAVVPPRTIQPTPAVFAELPMKFSDGNDPQSQATSYVPACAPSPDTAGITISYGGFSVVVNPGSFNESDLTAVLKAVRHAE